MRGVRRTERRERVEAHDARHRENLAKGAGDSARLADPDAAGGARAAPLETYSAADLDASIRPCVRAPSLLVFLIFLFI